MDVLQWEDCCSSMKASIFRLQNGYLLKELLDFPEFFHLEPTRLWPSAIQKPAALRFCYFHLEFFGKRGQCTLDLVNQPSYFIMFLVYAKMLLE